MLNWVKGLILAAVIGAGVTYHFVELGRVEQKWEQRVEEISRKVKEAEGEIVLRSSILEQEKNIEITRINQRADALVRSLQQRSSRTENANNNPTVESSCTGRELYKEDGEFLVREAARADRILEERNYYYEQYELIRNKLDEFNRTK